MGRKPLQLLFVRFHFGKCRMEVAVHDLVSNRRRLIDLTWQAQGTMRAPPENWYESVVGEVRYQRTQELKQARGRFISGG